MPFLVYFLYICMCVSLDIKEAFAISCKNEQNQDIDWFILYKLPRLEESPHGSKYAYLTSSDPNSWKLSSISITDENSMLGKTWKDLKRNENAATYLFYNDEPPKGFSGSAVGHLKGIVAFDENTGFWMMHTVPKFGVISKYEYPNSGLKYGQYAFCVTYGTSQLNKISEHLLYCNPDIYLYKTSESVVRQLTENSRTLFSEKPAFIHSSPFLKISTLQSIGNLEIKSFAKDNQLHQDLSSDIIAPTLKTSLISETWQNGAGHALPASCQGKTHVLDAKSIKVNTIDKMGETQSFPFSSSDDHSKWAVSIETDDDWICFADLNRMESQEKRGGGALCFQSRSVWKQFHDAVADTDMCPDA
ncbi:cell-death-related nuclease 7-like [Parasteatoda tepidariorum]|uniref:cell-death-related nuclease 7-like n=1 Tax=Parasteatoda tepidariorum TaxID=114398 RepID=UPI00077FCF89|nr:cell-death-related nuclease 7-like [Parasteatoda tepidariorum]